MEFVNQLLGEKTLAVWSAGIIWALIGIFAVKIYFIPSEKKLNFVKWFNENTIDVVKGIVWSLIILRLGDYSLTLIADKFDFTIPPTTDFVAIMIVISGVIQYKLHKNRKSIKKQIEV